MTKRKWNYDKEGSATGRPVWSSWMSAIGGGLIAGVCAGVLASPQPPAADARPAAANASRGAAALQPVPQDGVGLFEVEVEPVSTLAGGRGRQRLRAEATVSNHFGKRASFKVSRALVDASGNVVAGPFQQNAVALNASGRSAQAFDSPETLPDGHYKWRVVVVGSDGAVDSVQEQETFFKVSGGAITPLEASDWYALPEVNLANEG